MSPFAIRSSSFILFLDVFQISSFWLELLFGFLVFYLLPQLEPMKAFYLKLSFYEEQIA